MKQSAPDPIGGGDLPFVAARDGVRLMVRLTPRGRRNVLSGVVRGADGSPALQLRAVAPPVEGAANEALIAFLAKTLRLRKSAITIRSGETARLGGCTCPVIPRRPWRGLLNG